MLIIGEDKIKLFDIVGVASLFEKVVLDKASEKKILKTRKSIEKAISNKEVIYGVTTGFGAFKNKVISPNEVEKLQENLILSHAVAVGLPYPEYIVRAMMFLIVNYLSKGYSGVRPIVIKTLLEMLNKRVHPLVPQQGSVGSSGDLAPSAHIMLVLIGKGEATFQGKKMAGEKALKKAGIKPIKLQAKEGLALINNTSAMTANAVFAIDEAKKLADIADLAAALSCESLRSTTKAFDKKIHLLKPHKGQILVAARLRNFLKSSTMIDNNKTQDQYSIRCLPQVHGAVREAIFFAENIVNVEINSVTDNPLIFNNNNNFQALSGGNFHGEAIAIAMDALGLAVSEFANISDRRIAAILDPATNNGLPPFLVKTGGLNSGMMILQYTTASLASENKILAHPASVDSIPTSANVEDLVSMGTTAARKARMILTNVRKVLAIEFLVACQAIDFRLKNNYRLGKVTKRIYDKVRLKVSFFEKDELYYPYMALIEELMMSFPVFEKENDD